MATRTGGLLCMLLLPLLPLRAQADPFLESFSIVKDGDHVLLNWATRPGITCQGIDVLRSADQVAYTAIHHFEGICGGPTASVSYQYIDEHPLPNTRNYYRLSLGDLGMSGERSVEVILLGRAGYRVQPHPASGQATVHFDNAHLEPCRMFWADITGLQVGDWQTQGEFFAVDVTAFRPGIYVLRIQDSEGRSKATGKVVIRD
jgi:hypothetical protein